MLAIRMQRTGRKGYATFRIIVQDSRFSPKSGRVVARVGSYNPHTKEKSIDVDKISDYLSNGAQPTPRVVRLLKEEKIKLPSWVAELDNSTKKSTKNPDKLRKNQPKEPTAPEVTETPVVETEYSKDVGPESEAKETSAEETKAEEKESSEDKPAEEVKAEKPDEAEEKKEEPKEATKDDEKAEDTDKANTKSEAKDEA